MKKKVIISSVLTIALCLCLISGSTFALFTDEVNRNIVVTSGDVEISATVEATVYSAKENANGDLVDEKGNTYSHEATRTNFFTNGGEVTVDSDGNVSVARMTPGDRFDLKLTVTNTSDVEISYRYKIEAVETTLTKGDVDGKGIVVTIGSDKHSKVETWTTNWTTVAAPTGGSATYEQTISFELPIDAGNNYQDKNITDAPADDVLYKITVEAVQGNAVTEAGVVTPFN